MSNHSYESVVLTAPANASAGALAQQMATRSIGSLVIVDDLERPIGIVTDRDLLIRVVAPGLDPATPAEAVMSKPLVTAAVDEPIDGLVERMASAGLRRLPILRRGRLAGLVALDDLLVWLARELDDLSEATRSEILEGWRRSKRERKSADLESRLSELRDAVKHAGEEAIGLASKELGALGERLARLLGRDEEKRKDD